MLHSSLACLLRRLVGLRSYQPDVKLYDPMTVLVLTLYSRLVEGDQD